MPSGEGCPGPSEFLTDIALVISDLRGGGAQRVVTTLANAWIGRGRRVTVITMTGRESDFFYLDDRVERRIIGTFECDTSALGRVFANLNRLLALRRVLRQIRPGCIVSFILPTNILTILAAIGLPCRLVVSERNDPERQFLGRQWSVLRWLLYRWADRVTANSQGAVGVMKRYVPARKLAYLPNPLQLPANSSSTAWNERASSSLLAVGRLHHQKGYDILFRAFREFARESEGWRLQILGDGALRETLEAQAEALGIGDRLAWMGRVPDPAPYYRSAEIFVMPSRYEGVPNALLEAMSYALPVVVSDASPGPLEFVEDGVTGLVVPVGDATALAAALRSLAGERGLRQRLGEAARARVMCCALDRVLPVWELVTGLGSDKVEWERQRSRCRSQ